MNEKVGSIAAKLATFQHAFETTAADRDRLAAKSDELAIKHDQILLGMVAQMLVQDLKVEADALGPRLLNATRTLSLGPQLRNTSDTSFVVNAAARGLLDVADAMMRQVHFSKSGLDLVELSRTLNPEFYGQHHAIDRFFEKRQGFLNHAAYYADAIAAGLWPDSGTLEAQKAAIERGLPSILLITLPKSGSVFLWTTISASLQMPTFRVALTKDMKDEVLVPELLRAFAKGGMIAQHHLSPSKETLEDLKRSHVRRLVLHIRDPRQACVSWLHYGRKIKATPGRVPPHQFAESYLWQEFLKPASEWLHKWLEVDETDPDLEIVFSTHEEMAGRTKEHIEDLLQKLHVPSDQVDLKLSDLTGATHFRKGEKNEWLDFLSDDFKRRSTELIPNALARRFNWQEVHV